MPWASVSDWLPHRFFGVTPARALLLGRIGAVVYSHHCSLGSSAFPNDDDMASPHDTGPQMTIEDIAFPKTIALPSPYSLIIWPPVSCHHGFIYTPKSGQPNNTSVSD